MCMCVRDCYEKFYEKYRTVFSICERALAMTSYHTPRRIYCTSRNVRMQTCKRVHLVVYVLISLICTLCSIKTSASIIYYIFAKLWTIFIKKLLSLVYSHYTENFFVCEPDKVHQAGRIALQQIATAFSSSDLVGIRQLMCPASLKACQT